MSKSIVDDAYPLYPMFIYIYNADGTYGEPIQINSEAQLKGPGTIMVLRHAMQSGVEIRITDPGDLLVFHANHGKIIFDGQHPPAED